MKKYYLLTPGPTPVPARVAAKSSEPILHHRTKEFGDVFSSVQEGMKYVLKTKQDVIMISGSGTAAMDAAVANLTSAGDPVLVGSIGSFGERWIGICNAFGLKTHIIREEWGTPLSPHKVEEALKKNPEIKVVFVQHTDTSTGTVNDIKALGQVVSKTNAILVVDSVSGLAGEELHFDDWKCDVVVGGSQKGLMTAPGIAMATLSDKAWELNKSAKSPRFYSDFKTIRASIKDNETPWTPPVTLFASLSEALKMIKEETIEGVWARHLRLQKIAQAGIAAMGFPFLSSRPCSVLTAAKLPEGFDGNLLIKKMLQDQGVSIAGGQDHLKGKIFRLAHMGYMDEFDMMVGLTALEKTLTQMGYKLPKPAAGIEAAKAAMV
ncbi:MAG: pyridoxal-phosphate-dependent aminotransferase family protein [Elusimicrobiota bacterium]